MNKTERKLAALEELLHTLMASSQLQAMPSTPVNSSMIAVIDESQSRLFAWFSTTL